MNRRKVKLRKSKIDNLGKGYYPIYKTFDEKGIVLTYIVKFNGYEMEFNSLQKAKIMALKVI